MGQHMHFHCQSVFFMALWVPSLVSFRSCKRSRNKSISLLWGIIIVTVVHTRWSQFIIDHLDALYASHYLKYRGVYSVTFSISPSKCGKNLLPQFRNFDYLLYSKWSCLLMYGSTFSSFLFKTHKSSFSMVLFASHTCIIFLSLGSFVTLFSFWLIKWFITMIHKVCGRYKNTWVITSFSCHIE